MGILHDDETPQCRHATKDDCAAAECEAGGIRDCVYSEPLHYHHDGCPAAYSADVEVCDKEELLAELAAVKAELQRWRRITATPGHEGKALTPEAVAENLAALLGDVERLESERDRYLTRACVAEAKVAKVLELITPWSLAQHENILLLTLATGNLGRALLAQEILTAIGGKP